MEVWSHLSVSRPGPPRAIHPGDRIVEINGITGDPSGMLSECANKCILKLTVISESRKNGSILSDMISVYTSVIKGGKKTQLKCVAHNIQKNMKI